MIYGEEYFVRISVVVQNPKTDLNLILNSTTLTVFIKVCNMTV